MKTTLSFRALAITFFTALTVSYLLCIAADLWFGFRTLQALAAFLPGFAWPLTFGSFLAGLLWIAICSVYSAALITFPYNYLVKRERPV